MPDAEERVAPQPLAAIEVRAEVHHEALKKWTAHGSDAYWRFIVAAAEALNCPIVEIGCGYGRHLGLDSISYTGADYGYFIEVANELQPDRNWIKIDFERYTPGLFGELRDPAALYVTRGRLEHVRDTRLFLDCLAELARDSVVVVALEAAGRPGADELRPFFRRSVGAEALKDAFEARGLDTVSLGSIAPPEERATEELMLVAIGPPELLRACEELKLTQGSHDPAATADLPDGISPDSMLFAPEIPLLSSRLTPEPDRLLPELETGDVVQQILDAKREKRAFSMMRLGNGEARVLGFPDYVPPMWLARSMRNWFKSREAELRLHALQDEASAVIREADVIGVLRTSYLDPQYRLPLFLLERYGLVSAGTGLCAADVHLHMLKLDFYRELLAGEEGISIISGHALDESIANAFALSDVRLFKVPAQAKFFHDPAEEGHFPTVFDRLRHQIDVRWPGEVFLIGAGFLGKIYCGWVKQRGGIAVDIGSVFDLWAGETTRGGDTSVAERHRLS
ncbi:MAG: hypothetical protein WDZ46_04230 [Solirubrobacterales bacterium]